MAQITFNANQVAPDEGRTGPIPNDWYLLVIESTEVKPNNQGTGTILGAVAKVVEGQFANRKIFINFNIQHQSVQAQEIGQKQLSALCHATRVLMINDTAQLHNIPFKAKVKVRPAQGQYDESNEISAYRDASDPTAVSKNVGVNLSPPAGRPAAPPPAAPQQYAPQQPPIQQAQPTAAQAQWNPPATQQPWQAPGAPAQAPVQQPQYQQPPVQQQQPQQPQFQAPVEQQQPQFQQPVQQQQGYQPGQDPNVQQAQQVQPSWAGVPTQAAQVQQPAQQPVQQQAAAPAPNPAGAIAPPWMQQAPQ